MIRFLVAVFGVFTVTAPLTACYGVCTSCIECASDAECEQGKHCEEILGICEDSCDEHADCGDGTRCVFRSGECTDVDACSSNDDCTNFTVCDLDERLCVPDSCTTDADCELEEAPRCDVNEGVCAAGDA